MRAEDILRQREFNYRRIPERRLRTVEEARAFVEGVGFCHFWPIKGAELPNLFHAIAGRVRLPSDGARLPAVHAHVGDRGVQVVQF